METANVISHFSGTVAKDPRIGTTHIGLYSVLLVFSFSDDGKHPVTVSRESLMRAAKIGSPNTWFKILNDLCETGCVIYRPSFSPKGGSRISLCLPETTNEKNGRAWCREKVSK